MGRLSTSGAARVAYIPPRITSADTSSDGTRTFLCAGNATSGDNVRQQGRCERPRQTMRHCCQLIPLQITLSFIVSSLSLFPSLASPVSLFLSNDSLSFRLSKGSPRAPVFFFLRHPLRLDIVLPGFSREEARLSLVKDAPGIGKIKEIVPISSPC